MNVSSHINTFITTFTNNLLLEVHNHPRLSAGYASLRRAMNAFDRTTDRYIERCTAIPRQMHALLPKYEIGMRIPQHYGSYSYSYNSCNQHRYNQYSQHNQYSKYNQHSQYGQPVRASMAIAGLPSTRLCSSIYLCMYRIFTYITSNIRRDRAIDRIEECVIPAYFVDRNVRDIRNYESGDVVNDRVDVSFEIERDGRVYCGKCMVDLGKEEIVDYDENEIV